MCIWSLPRSILIWLPVVINIVIDIRSVYDTNSIRCHWGEWNWLFCKFEFAVSMCSLTKFNCETTILLFFRLLGAWILSLSHSVKTYPEGLPLKCWQKAAIQKSLLLMLPKIGCPDVISLFLVCVLKRKPTYKRKGNKRVEFFYLLKSFINLKKYDINVQFITKIMVIIFFLVFWIIITNVEYI